MATEPMVIAGGGLAGATAAKTLRTEGFEGPITLLAAEPRIPYLRPPLSKEFLLGKADEESVPVMPSQWYVENGVELLTGTSATAIDTREHSVALDDGSLRQYAKLLLATGAQPRRIPLPGSELEGVMTFRTFDDSIRLRSLLEQGGRRVVMIGSGWIGMELAAAARSYGNEVTLLGLEDIPLSTAIGPELAPTSGGCTKTTESDSICRPVRFPSKDAAGTPRPSPPTPGLRFQRTWRSSPSASLPTRHWPKRRALRCATAS